MLSQLINRPCVIHRRLDTGTTDDYGNLIPDTLDVAAVCELQLRTSRGDNEPDRLGELSDTDWVAYFLPGTVINTGDTLEVDGQRYEMVGEPWHARNPRTQQASHIEAFLRRTASTGDDA